jgi:hypothetical protein
VREARTGLWLGLASGGEAANVAHGETEIFVGLTGVSLDEHAGFVIVGFVGTEFRSDHRRLISGR